jgi:CheY-like chemotaxis protein
MKNILLASASKVFLRRNSNLLLRRDLELFTAMSGAEALRLHEEHSFDLILADLDLEEMSGCAFCSLVRQGESFQQVPIILICHNFTDSIEKASQSGASAILLKPIDPIQLVETIGRLIDLKMVRCKRVVLNVKVLIKKLELEFFCLSSDISTTGILLATEYQLELGSRIICEFTLPGSCRIETEGEVIRSLSTVQRKGLYGIKFIDLPLPYRQAIDSYVNSTAH